MANVRLNNLSKQFGSLVATEDVSLDIPDGQLAVLVGPSGCGKTTTLRMIAGLEQPTEGTIHFGTDDVTETQPQNRDVSMVFQDLALYPHLTAYDNVAFPLRADGKFSDDEIESRVQEVAEIVDCDEFLNQRVTELSGGQRQRVALARALIREPEVFLMDEPFSDLDELLKRNLRAEVLRLQRRLDITMVHVTHDQEEAMTLGDILVVMNNGEIAQLGDPDTVFNSPETVFVATFIGSPQINQFYCDVEWEDGDTAVLTDGDVSFTLTEPLVSYLRDAGDEVAFFVRPQHLRWSADEPDDAMSVGVSVEVIEQIGTEDIVRCRTGDDTEVTAVLPAGTIEEGDVGYLVIDPAHAHLFDGHGSMAERLNYTGRQKV